MTIDFSSVPIDAELHRFTEGMLSRCKLRSKPFVTHQRHTRLSGRALLVASMTVVLFSSTAWSEGTGELDPGDLVSMMDHAAIVETMSLACENSRPDLAEPFRAAQQLWWVRNAQIHETLAALERAIGMPRAKAFLDYFSTLQRSLRQQIEDQKHIGNTAYAAHCDGVLKDLIRGRLDYRPSPAVSGTG